MNYKIEPLLAVNNPYQKLAIEFLSKPQHQYFKTNLFQEKKNITDEEYISFCKSQYEIIHPVFIKESEKLIEDRQYFYGCPLNLYKETYTPRLKDFLIKFPDAEEIEFLSKEGQKYTGEFLYELSDSLKLKIQYSIDKTIQFLEFRAAEIGYFLFGNKNKEEEEQEEQQIKSKDKSLEIPYKIALLNEIGFFDLPHIKNLPKTKQRLIIARIIGGTDRFIEGNISVLNENSKEDPLRFTAIGKMDEVKQFLSTLNNK